MQATIGPLRSSWAWRLAVPSNHTHDYSCLLPHATPMEGPMPTAALSSVSLNAQDTREDKPLSVLGMAPGQRAMPIHPPRPQACAHDHQQCIGAVPEAKQDMCLRRHVLFCPAPDTCADTTWSRDAIASPCRAPSSQHLILTQPHLSPYRPPRLAGVLGS